MRLGYILGDFFLKLVWSPCPLPPFQQKKNWTFFSVSDFESIGGGAHTLKIDFLNNVFCAGVDVKNHYFLRFFRPFSA
jgi:hypothetical protein